MRGDQHSKEGKTMNTSSAMREVQSICPYCGVGCGVRLQAENGRIVGLKPDPEHPISQGTLCPKGATAHEFVHHPDRLTQPLLRKNDNLVPVSWDEAYDYIVRELTRILEQHGPEAIGMLSSSRATVEENYLAQKLARAVLGTNHVDNCFRICHSATTVGLKQVLGSGAMTNSIAEFLDPGPKAILMVGSNAPHAHPIIWNVWLKKAVKNGTQLIVIDPRTTDAVKLATLHLKIRPGSEVALLNAMAQHILAQGLHDEGFIEERCEGFREFESTVEKYTPESVEELCGVPAEEIQRAAELYARERPASIVYGLGITEHRTGVDNVQALANLALLTGNLGRPASGVNALRGQNNVQGATDMCAPEWLPGYQGWDDPDALTKFEEAYGAKLPVPQGAFIWCSRMWERALRGELKALYVIGADPALSEGNLAKVEKALQSLELLIVQDFFPNRTSELAHVVLPAATFAEKDGTFINTERRVQLVRKAIEPVGESKPDWRIFCELAERLGYERMRYSHPWEIFEEIRALVPIYAGMTYERLERSYGLQWPCPDEDHPGTKFLHEGRFPRGRARLKGIEYFPPAELPDDDYPLLLTTGRTFMQYNAGTMTRRTRSGLGEPENFVQINAADAEVLGVSNGDPVRVATRRGEVTAKAKIADIREGVIWMPFHYAEAPTNALTGDALDPVCGITELKVCAARIARA
jgi:formate dehydrogenase alpha subunit